MQVVRFTLESQRSFDVPGVGLFINGVMDVPASNTAAVARARYKAPSFGAAEYGTVDSATAAPSLPAVPLPPSPDPYPQYLQPGELLDGDGKVLDQHLPDRLTTVGLRAAFERRVGTAVITRDGAGRITSATEDGELVTYTRDGQGRIVTETRGGVVTTYGRDTSGRVSGWASAAA